MPLGMTDLSGSWTCFPPPADVNAGTAKGSHGLLSYCHGDQTSPGTERPKTLSGKESPGSKQNSGGDV